MDLELISFKICPFVQRSVITLLYKQVPHRITYIDLDAPPDWFPSVSPFGKVPVLRVDGSTSIFESAVINEFIDEVSPGSLHPSDPVRRAVNRSWIEFGSACLVDLFQLSTAATEAEFGERREALLGKLRRLEQTLGEGPFFNGPALALVDTAFAPLFMRLALLNAAHPIYPRAELPRVAAWSEALLALPAVQQSVVPEFPELYYAHLRKRGGYAAEVFVR